MSILLVGCGYWGQNWAKTLFSLGALGALCESHPKLQETLKAQYPDTPVYAGLSDALQHPGIEGVVVATPVPTHTTVARTCLLADRPVLVEKPLTLTTGDAKNLVQLASERGLVLAVGHLLMYHPALQKLKAMMDAGELGDILSVQCTRVNLGKVRNEENAWWSLAPHDISILQLLLDEPLHVENVIRMNPLRRPEIEDTVFATFITASGKSASIHVSWLSPVKKHETVVIGSRKIAIFDDALPAEQKLAVLDYELDWSGTDVQRIERGTSRFVSYPAAEPLLTLEAKAFIAAAREGIPLVNNGQQGLQNIEILEQVHQRLHPDTKPLSVTV